MTVYTDSSRSSAGIFEIRNPGGCSGCNATTVSPMPKSYTDPVADPFAGLAYPSETGLPVYSDGSYHGPGVYSTELAISADTTFAPGIYILEAGLGISNGTTDASSGVLLFNGCGQNSPRCAAGTGGAISFTGQSAVSFTPLQSGAYQQLAVWQPPQNANGITFAGKTATNILRGIVYAPNGNLSVGSGNGGIQIWCVAGTNITISGNGNAVIGQ
jgi:hypothetical protein